MVKRLVTTLWLLAFFPSVSSGAQPTELEDQVRVIAADLRCPVCQNLSVADSPSELAQQMRAIIESQLKEGKTPDQVRAFFVSKYGEWVLLSPTRSGFSLVVWVLPYLALGGGLIFVLLVMRRWARANPGGQSSKELSPDLRQRIQKDLANDKEWGMAAEIEGPHGPLVRERARLYTELRDLEFDCQAGRISKTDYDALRRGYEEQIAGVLKELDTTPAATLPRQPAKPAMNKTVATPPSAVPRRTWIFAATAAFLLIFGVTLGVLLGNSLRPRTSSDDSITGDFLTGTPGSGISSGSPSGIDDLPSLLAQGRRAFERQEWPQAIDAFKKALAMDANQPEAHSYMGLILAGAGHADSALMAFDRALSVDPEYPLALWGSGMVLYRQKGDTEGGSRRLKTLLVTLPPGPEKEQLKKTIVEMAEAKAEGPDTSTRTANPTGKGIIAGTITVDPELQSQGSSQGVLFIIARSAESQGGPPLAVKRFERPAFPLKYSLGQENTMIPGTQFKGRMMITARLDSDGDPLTRGEGDLTGTHKGNPVNVDNQTTVDIILTKPSP